MQVLAHVKPVRRSQMNGEGFLHGGEGLVEVRTFDSSRYAKMQERRKSPRGAADAGAVTGFAPSLTGDTQKRERLWQLGWRTICRRDSVDERQVVCRVRLLGVTRVPLGNGEGPRVVLLRPFELAAPVGDPP